MKRFILLGLLGVSSLSYGQSCHISLYNQYNQPKMNFYSVLDKNCESAARQCYQAIRMNRLSPTMYRCYTISIRPDKPVVKPVVKPAIKPVVKPEVKPIVKPVVVKPEVKPAIKPVVAKPEVKPQIKPENKISSFVENTSDSRRPIEMGETVLLNGREWIVTDVPANDLFNLKPVGGKDRDIINNVPRAHLAITRGCHQRICSKDSVVDLTITNFVAVVGIDFEGRIITRDLENAKLLILNDPSTLARTNGCVETRYGEICINTIVQDNNNRYFKLVGIQSNGQVVIEAEDSYRPLTKNVNPSTLLPVR